MKMKRSKDPSATKAEKSSFQSIYPEPTNDWPYMRAVSDLTNPRTLINDPNVYRNREIEEEQKMASNFFYNNVDPRRKQELSDARMVQEDHNAMANLSEQPVYHTFNANEHVEKLSMFNQSTRTRR